MIDRFLSDNISKMYQSLQEMQSFVPSMAKEAMIMTARLKSVQEMIALDLKEMEVNPKAIPNEALCIKELEEYVLEYTALMHRAIAETVRRMRDMRDDRDYY